MVIGFNCTLTFSITFHLIHPWKSGNTPTTPSPIAIYSMTQMRKSSHSITDYTSAFPILLFILARCSSRGLRKSLNKKRTTSSEPSPLNITSFSNNPNTRDSELTSDYQCHCPTPLLTKNLRIHDRSSMSSSLETMYMSPPLSYLSEPVLPLSYRTRTPGTQSIGPSTNQHIGHLSLNPRSRLKSIGVTLPRTLASTNPFHPCIYPPKDQVMIELIEYGHEGLLQEHPAANNPIPISPLNCPLPETPSPSPPSRVLPKSDYAPISYCFYFTCHQRRTPRSPSHARHPTSYSHSWPEMSRSQQRKRPEPFISKTTTACHSLQRTTICHSFTKD